MPSRKIWIPDTYVIIFFVIVAAAAATHFIKPGHFQRSFHLLDGGDNVVVVLPDAQQREVSVESCFLRLDSTSSDDVIVTDAGAPDTPLVILKKAKPSAVYFTVCGKALHLVTEYGEFQTRSETAGVAVFAEGGGAGVLNSMFEGLVKGDKWGSAVGVIAFILVVGGAFGIVLRTGAVEAGLMGIIRRYRHAGFLLIPILFVLFALGGATFGMSEEAIPFAMLVVPMMVATGYDSITGIVVTYGATQIGFATSWQNPFSVAIAQSIAGVPAFSGAGFRVLMFVVFCVLCCSLTMLYASWIRKNPTRSVAWESDSYFRNSTMQSTDGSSTRFRVGHGVILLGLVAGMGWILWGVQQRGYYLPEIAAIFFAIGLFAGVVGVVFRLQDMHVNDIAEAFRKGAGDLVGAALVVGMAQGIIVVLGHSDAGTDSVLNTILASVASLLDSVPPVISAWMMFGFQSVFNFFVVSGSGQAALTMPLMAPLAQILEIPRDVAVLAFQLGDGLTNLIVPTSGCLMGVLGIARLDWTKWLRFQILVQIFLFVLGSGFILAGMAWL